MSSQGGVIELSNGDGWMIGTAVAYLLLIANLPWLELDTYLHP